MSGENEPITEISPEERALAQAIVVLRDQYTRASDIEIAHYLLVEGYHGKDIPRGQLERIVKLAGQIKPSTFNLLRSINALDPSIPSYLGFNIEGAQRHEGPDGAWTSDHVKRDVQGFDED